MIVNYIDCQNINIVWNGSKSLKLTLLYNWQLVETKELNNLSFPDIPFCDKMADKFYF